MKINMLKIKNIANSGAIVIIQVNIKVLHITYIIENIVWLKKFLHFFAMDQSNYDYHFVIKQLAKKFAEQFTCLGGNT